MNILISGGAGFIGSHTCDALMTAGHRVRILDSLEKTVHPKGRPAYLNPGAEFLFGDVRDKETWRTALCGVDAVYHLAAYQDYLTDFSTFFHTNAVSTALLYEVLIEAGLERQVRKVVVASSQAVMGEGRYICRACCGEPPRFVYPSIRLEAALARSRWDHRCPDCDRILEWLPSDESVAHPGNPYALSKHSQEQIAVQLGRRYDIPTVVLRYSIVQGPRQSLYNAYSGAMRIFSLALMFDRSPIIFEDGNQIRDFVHIDDVVSANLLVLNRPEADHNVFNVGGGRAWTVNDFYEAMQQVVGKRKPAVSGGYYRYGDTRHIFSDTGKLQALGWRPRRSVYDSIQAYWEYLGEAQFSDNLLDYAEEHMKELGVIRKTHTTI